MKQTLCCYKIGIDVLVVPVKKNPFNLSKSYQQQIYFIYVFHSNSILFLCGNRIVPPLKFTSRYVYLYVYTFNEIKRAYRWVLYCDTKKRLIACFFNIKSCWKALFLCLVLLVNFRSGSPKICYFNGMTERILGNNWLDQSVRCTRNTLPIIQHWFCSSAYPVTIFTYPSRMIFFVLVQDHISILKNFS